MLVYNLHMLILYCVASLITYVLEFTTFCVGRLNAAGLSCSNPQQEGGDPMAG